MSNARPDPECYRHRRLTFTSAECMSSIELKPARLVFIQYPINVLHRLAPFPPEGYRRIVTPNILKAIGMQN